MDRDKQDAYEAALQAYAAAMQELLKAQQFLLEILNDQATQGAK